MKFFIFSINEKKHVYLKRILSWAAVLIYMAVIFTLSNQSGTQSNKLSNNIVKEIKSHTVLPSMIQHNQKAYRIDYNYILRKVTHFFEYFILAILFYFAFACCDVSLKGCVIISFLLSTFYASLDEYHQWFISGRASRVRDIAIDAGGALLSLIIIYLYRKMNGRQRVVQNE